MTLRTFFILAVVAVIGVALAAGAVISRPGDFRFANAGTSVFPDLAGQLAAARGFELESKEQGTLRFARDDSGNWTVADRADFPAKSDAINALLVELSELTYVAPKTAKPALFERLELGNPAEGGSGIRVKFTDAGGATLANLMAGNGYDGLEGVSEGGVYIHLPDTGDRAWLAKGKLEPGREVRDWIERNIFGMRVNRIRQATVTHPDGQVVDVFKDQPEDVHFVLTDVPGNMKIKSPFTVDSVAGAIGDFLMEDMAPRADKPIDIDAAIRVRFQTWNGLTLTIAMQKKSDKDIWMVAGVDGNSAADDAARAEAEALAAKLSPWAFQISDFRYDTIGKRLEDLLDPVGNSGS